MATILPIVLRLIPEELYILYQQLDFPEQQALRQDLLLEWSEFQEEVALDVARRGLIARQLLRPDVQENFGLHPLALAVVIGSLLAQSSVTIRTQTSTGNIEALDFYAYDNDIHLTHAVLPDNLHEFGLFPDKAVYRQAIQSAVELEVPASSSSLPATVPTQLFGRAIAMAQEGEQQTVAMMLGESSMPEETIQALATTLNGLHWFRTFTVRDVEVATDLQDQAFSFLHGENVLWLMDPVPDDATEGLILLRPLSSAEYQEIVQTIVGHG